MPRWWTYQCFKGLYLNLLFSTSIWQALVFSHLPAKKRIFFFFKLKEDKKLWQRRTSHAWNFMVKEKSNTIMMTKTIKCSNFIVRNKSSKIFQKCKTHWRAQQSTHMSKFLTLPWWPIQTNTNRIIERKWPWNSTRIVKESREN